MSEQVCIKCGHSDGVDVAGGCLSPVCGQGCIKDDHPCDCDCEFVERALPETEAEEQMKDQVNENQTAAVPRSGFAKHPSSDAALSYCADCRVNTVSTYPSSVELCPFHAAAPALYEALVGILKGMPQFSDEPVGPPNDCGVAGRVINVTVGDIRRARAALGSVNVNVFQTR